MSERAVAQKQGIFELLRNRSYAQFMLARTISRFGDSVDSIAYGWMVYLLTGSKLLMGTLMAVNFLPNILFGLFAGAMVDRMSPQKVIVLAYGGRGTLVGLTALLFSLGELQVWHLFVMTVLVSLLECFASPAETSSVPRLLPPGLLLSGNALSSSIARMSELAGIAAAGALIAGVGIAWTLWIDAALFGASAFFMTKVVFPGIRPDVRPSTIVDERNELGEATVPHSSLFSEVNEAFRFLRTIPVLLMTSFLFAFVNFCLMPFNVLRTPYVTEILNAGAGGLSLLSGMMVAGMVLGGLWLTNWGSNCRKSLLVIIGIVMLGLSYAMTALPAYIGQYQLAVAAVFALLMGFGIPLATTPLASYMMEVTPSGMLGRVSAFQSMLCLSAVPLGSLLSGAIAEWVPMPILFIGFGIAMALSAAGLIVSRTFRHALK